MSLLEGVRVLDYGSLGPGARALRILADYGAEAIRIEAPTGAGRQSLAYHSYSGMRGIRRCVIDLKHPEASGLVLDLAATCDVIVDGFRPGVADRLGIGYRDVQKVKSDVIYCAATGYGQEGPYANWVGHDLNYLAISGLLYCGGRGAHGSPTIPGATIGDAAGGGLHAALAISCALVQRRGNGSGQYLDVSATDGLLGIMAVQVDDFLATGEEAGPGRGLVTGQFACYGVYECSDHRWIAVAAIETKFFANLCGLLEHREWIELQYDEERQEALRSNLAAEFATRTRDEWSSFFAGTETCVSPVLSISEVTEDTHFAARNSISDAVHPVEGRFRQVAPIWAGCERPEVQVLEGEAMTREVLSGLGYSEASIDKLTSNGLIT